MTLSTGAKWFAASFTFIITIVAGLVFMASDTISANDIYHITRQIRVGLLEIEEVQHVQDEAPAYLPFNRQPRHVIQKTRDMLLRINVLLKRAGLESEYIEVTPITHITDKIVAKQLDHLLQATTRLRTKHNLPTEFGQEVEPHFGKTITDVYASLQVVEKMLEALGVPITSPNEAFQFAVIVRDDIQFIMHNRFHMCDDMSPEHAKDKNAADVYYYLYTVLGEIHEMTRREFSHHVPPNLHVPQLKRPPISEEDVIDLLDQTIADVGAMKHSMGMSRVSGRGKPVEKKTHTDVYNLIGSMDHALKCRLERT